MAFDGAPRRRWGQGYTLLVLQALGLGTIWVALSGKIDALHLTFGAVSIAIVLWTTNGLIVSRRVPRETITLYSVRPVKTVMYVVWLLKEIVLANIDVARIVLTPSLPIDPVLLHFRSSLDSSLAKVALANSITLTPGTVTLQITGRDFLVHAITESAATGPTIDEMERRLAEVFGKQEVPPKLDLQIRRTLREEKSR